MELTNILKEIDNSNWTAQSLVQEIEKIMGKYFPTSIHWARFDNMIYPVVTVLFQIGQKKDYYNQIMENSPIKISLTIEGFNNDGSLKKDIITMEPHAGSMCVKSVSPYMVYDRVKFPIRKKTGNPDSILKAIDKLFSESLKIIKANFDKMTPEHKEWVINYI